FFFVVELLIRGTYLVRDSMVRYIPLPYAFGDDYGPKPPWLDRLLIIESDPVLIWKHTPNAHRVSLDVFSPVDTADDRTALLRRFNPALPAKFRGSRLSEMQLNADGFRGPLATRVKPSSTIRVACLGDSWTFGQNVNDDQTYPSRLAAWLQREDPGRRYEVFN